MCNAGVTCREQMAAASVQTCHMKPPGLSLNNFLASYTIKILTNKHINNIGDIEALPYNSIGALVWLPFTKKKKTFEIIS